MKRIQQLSLLLLPVILLNTAVAQEAAPLPSPNAITFQPPSTWVAVTPSNNIPVPITSTKNTTPAVPAVPAPKPPVTTAATVPTRTRSWQSNPWQATSPVNMTPSTVRFAPVHPSPTNRAISPVKPVTLVDELVPPIPPVPVMVPLTKPQPIHPRIPIQVKVPTANVAMVPVVVVAADAAVPNASIQPPIVVPVNSVWIVSEGTLDRPIPPTPNPPMVGGVVVEAALLPYSSNLVNSPSIASVNSDLWGMEDGSTTTRTAIPIVTGNTNSIDQQQPPSSSPKFPLQIVDQVSNDATMPTATAVIVQGKNEKRNEKKKGGMKG